MQIFVGSSNPVKVSAVVTAASETWPEILVTGVEVESGISTQPRSDVETRTGSQNRASAAFLHGQKQAQETTTEIWLGVGLEGGVFETGNGEMWSTVWVTVTADGKQFFEANGARFKVPEIIAKTIRLGEDMGPVVEKIVGEADVRKKQGMIGVITNGFVDRTEEYMGICKMALGLYHGHDWLKKYL